MGLKGLEGVVVNEKATVGVASGEVLAAGRSDEYVALTNDSDTIIYISLGSPAVLNQGFRLNANGGVLELFGDSKFNGQINAISSGASKNLAIVRGN